MGEAPEEDAETLKAIQYKRWAKNSQGILVLYGKRLAEDYPPQRMDTSQPIETFNARTSRVNALRHAHWMLEQMSEMISRNQRGKFNRWLGFVQGVLGSFGVYSIDEMRDHNR